MIIAIDGTSASGKGTLAKKISEHFNFSLLETGFLYRFVAWKMMKENNGEYSESIAIDVAKKFTEKDVDLFETVNLKSSLVANNASKVAALPDVRSKLLDFQRDFATNPPNKKKGSVLDGRDIGTFVCPNAEIKFFITASLKERSRRRTLELESLGQKITFNEIFKDLKERDERDSVRKTAPLKKANDAFLIDTTNFNPQEVLDIALDFIAKNNC